MTKCRRRAPWRLGKSSVAAAMLLASASTVTSASAAELVTNGEIATEAGDLNLARVGDPSNMFAATPTALESAFRQDTGSLHIDHVSVEVLASVLPEPAIWAFLLLGFSLVGAGMRARRSAPLVLA